VISQYDNADGRLRGRALQARRLRLWTRSPYCAECKRLTDWPSGFEADHIVPLHKGGKDEEANLQVLCVITTRLGKAGCHEDKTNRDLNRRVRAEIGADGWPVGG
jgi:5-methylcytosine-specific restriction protein A